MARREPNHGRAVLERRELVLLIAGGLIFIAGRWLQTRA